ncbi:branched-chain amino acid ABC transporter permease [Nocardioides sp.]|jgi:branched-chain amino acid transport system permease protein|uniref:branched-chain amino acid ABC transporter permease n=1 Tax=Nocardioides sp. TaxID=35761 RepID=UPI001DDE6B1C|nr:branched-chain amino acid ABC transporter permease [Nocardioides sp.]MBU1803213.1 branched-chain amino acid ABC transporter permease [Actinomycetota bacterium]
MSETTTTTPSTDGATRGQQLSALWQDYPLIRHLVTAAIGLAVVIVVLTAVDDFQATKLTEMAYIAIAAGGLTLLTGLNGQISLGHGALMAFGAYTTALLYDDREVGTPLVVVVLASVLVTVLVGILIGIAAARLHGPYLAGATLTLAIAVPEIGKYFDQLGGDQGLRLFVPEIPQWATDIAYYLTGSDPSRSKYVAFLAWVTLIVVFILLANLASSRIGRRWAAVRDDEVAAELAGIDLTRARVSAFVVSAAAAGAAGAMFALAQRTVGPLGFSLNLSLTLLAIVVLGGLGSLTGAILLSGVLVFLPQIVMDLGSGADLDATRASQMATLTFGLVMVLVILLAPRGLMGGVRALGLRLRAARAGRRTPPATGGSSSSGAAPSPTTDPASPSSTAETAEPDDGSTPITTKKGTS